MDVKTYKITKIEGEYAYLVDECGEELFIAMALLPLGADIGVNLKCSDKDYDNVIDYAQGSNYNFCVYHFQEPESKSRYYGIKTYMYFELPLFGRNDMFAIPIYGETYSFYEIRWKGLGEN